ncbi:hypothetical protein RHSIM_Rhsim04G0098700 [Rhododendron simsii]|uniref:Uncharacterized protein n=1 Tax=Rhododendron simsii TaxID=118357 RepID=A0A834HEH5_RHOSS|nr:hypothetical protein RHSIM_Rhsim04G0098700 [Rhododendron simsii]
MPESRDRLSRPDDVRAAFAGRRQSIGGISILLDEEQRVDGTGTTPFRWGATAMTGTHGPTGAAATRGGGSGVRRGILGTPRSNNRNRLGRNLHRSPVVGRENMGSRAFRRGRGRSMMNSVLPSWYPRTPLRDITAVVRVNDSQTLFTAFDWGWVGLLCVAIERRRASLRESDGLQIDSPIPQDQDVVVPSSELASGAQLVHDLSMITPNPTVGIKKAYPPSVGKVPKILLDITNQKAGEPDCLTPQKKLLNSIDTVEKVVMEELGKLKGTPSAKKVERQKKVRTLMSMR